MAKKKEQAPDADGRIEVTLNQGLRTHDDKVFFPGTVSVDQRTAKSIDHAANDEVHKRRELSVEEEEGDNPLGDTRTSTAMKQAAQGGGARFENVTK